MPERCGPRPTRCRPWPKRPKQAEEGSQCSSAAVVSARCSPLGAPRRPTLKKRPNRRSSETPGKRAAYLEKKADPPWAPSDSPMSAGLFGRYLYHETSLVRQTHRPPFSLSPKSFTRQAREHLDVDARTPERTRTGQAAGPLQTTRRCSAFSTGHLTRLPSTEIGPHRLELFLLAFRRRLCGREGRPAAGDGV